MKAVLIFMAVALHGQTPVELATLKYIDIQQGTGAPAAPGKRFTVHYTGRLKDGTKFDSSVDRNEPFKFVQGQRQVISGWDIGFEGMKVGGKRRLIIPYQLAYGELGRGQIPPKAELTFEVELLDVSDVPALSAAIDLITPYADLETRVIALAKSRPEAPSLSRIVEANRAILETPALTGTIVDQLTASFAAVHKQLDSARAGSLTTEAEVMGKPSTRRGQFTALIAAIAEELGKLEAAK